MRTRRWPTAVVAAVALSVVVLAGCGSGEEAVAPQPGGCREVTGDAFTIVATNMAFEDECLTVAPGRYDVTFRNTDEGTGHDLHIVGADVDDRTDLTVGPDTHQLDVDLTVPGTYRFTCDPHANMVGQIVVTEPPAPAEGDADPTTTAPATEATAPPTGATGAP